MREALGIDKSQDILASIENLPKEKQEAAHETIRLIERDAMSSMTPQDGLSELMQFLDSVSVRRAICTRNFVEPTKHLLTHFLKNHEISPVITREFSPPKPSAEPLIHICSEWGIRPSECLMIGDGKDDLLSAQAAGMDSVLLQNGMENIDLIDTHKPQFVVESLQEIIEIVKQRLKG